ncbi:hypothetical protein D3C72_1866100 [compost metagenome]
MCRIRIHTVSAAGSNDSNLRHALACIDRIAVFFHVLHRVAHLHRAGVRAQQVGGVLGATFYVEGVVHGARGMVFRRVQRREVKPVGFNLGAFGHIKTHGAKNALNALHRDRHRVQTACTTATARQGHIQHFCLQMRLQLGIG